MARFVPELEGKVFPSAAERKVAARLRAGLDDRYVVMHSVGLARHARKRWAEADFVVIGPEGVFCLEVKGGRVSRRDGMWSFVDRDDRETLKREGPFDQAGGAAGALAAYFRELRLTAADGRPPLTGYGVVTPDCVLHATGPNEDRELILDQRDLGESMTSYLTRLHEFHAARLDESGLDPSDVDAVADAVRGDFDAVVLRSARTDRIESELVRYTEGQRRLMEALAGNERVIVSGAAGTGKTLLALNETTRLAEQGRSVLLTCSAPGLAEDLAQRVDPGVVVRPFGLLGAEGGTFDALVVDEGQDLLTDGSALDTLDRVLDGGLAHGTWRFFHDPNQALFGSPAPGALDRLEDSGATRAVLTVNCRNTKRTIEVIRLLSGDVKVAAGDVYGPPVTTCTSWDAPHIDRISAQLDRLRAADVPDAEVVVLVEDERSRSEIAAALGLSTTPARAETTRCLTITEFKGRESPVVVLAGPSSLDTVEGRRLAYVGASRARVEVAVVLPPECEESYLRRSAEFARLIVEAMLGGES